MGLFSGLFKKNKKTFHSPEWGEFMLVFSNGANRIWGTKKDGISYTVRGNDEAPFADQLSFLSKTKHEIEKLGTVITNKIKKELAAEGMQNDFDQWHEKFTVTNIEIVNLNENSPQWNIYFRDRKKGTDITLFFEGSDITRFSIDR